MPGSASSPVRPATLAEMLACLRRSWRSLAAWTLSGLLASAAWMALVRPSFQARAAILIESEAFSGLLGDLAMLATLASAPATAGEIVVLESRTLAEQTLASGADPQGRWDPLDERHAGLATLVQDEELSTLALARRALFHPPRPDVPLVLPARELHARVERRDPAAPERLSVEFLGERRVRVSSAGWAERLGLRPRAPQEFDYAPRARLEYRGLALELEASGDYAGARFAIEHLSEHDALDELRERIHVREAALDSGVIEIVIEDSDPRRAARTANALCRNYLDSLERRGERRASATVDYIRALLERELTRFDEVQEGLVRIQQGTPELLAPEGAASSLIDEMAGLEVERIRLELSGRAFEEMVAALDAGDARALAGLDDLVSRGVVADPITAGYLGEIAALDARHATLAADLKDEHPLVQQNRAAVAELLARTREQLERRLASQRSRAAEIDRQKDELRARLGAMPAGVREIADARLQLEIHGEIVPYLIKGLQGAEITRSTAETRADLIDPAVPPTELSSPDPLRALALGLLAGLCLGMVRSLVREPREGLVHSVPELAEATGAELAVGLPRLHPAGGLFLRASPAGEEAEALRGLRSALEATPPRRLLGVTTVAASLEAASVAAELALALALAGRRTLLVEANLRRPSQAARLGLAESAGLAAHLETGAPWRELVRPGASDGPSCLPAGKPASPPGDLLAREAMQRFLAEALPLHDAVVLDLPAQEGAPEVAALARACDALLLVHRARTLPRARVAACARDLRAAGVRFLAAVLVERRR